VTTNFDDPASRLALIERVGLTEYNRQIQAHIDASVLETVAGHDIRPVNTRFGRLHQVGRTGRAFSTLQEARDFAKDNPA
jgi:hypothetical protein